MKLTIEAACGCNKGKIRSKNEDNFYFDGKCLELNNEGLRNPALYEEFLKSRLCMAIFDGMGGENFGDIASYTAAQQMLQTERSLADFIIGERQYLERLTRKINQCHRHATTTTPFLPSRTTRMETRPRLRFARRTNIVP